MSQDQHQSSLPIEYNYHHHIDVKGVVIPTWVAILLSLVGFSASIVVLLAVLVFNNAANKLAETQANQTKEMRLIDLHILDIENLLIRSGLAKRSDFVQRENTTDKKEEE